MTLDLDQLSDEDVEALDRRMRRRRLDANRPQDPAPLSPDSWAGQVAAAQERKRQERVAAAKAEEDRQIAARERRERAVQERFEATVDERAPIEVELASIEAEHEQIRKRSGELFERERDLRAQLDRLLEPTAEDLAEDAR